MPMRPPERWILPSFCSPCHPRAASGRTSTSFVLVRRNIATPIMFTPDKVHFFPSEKFLEMRNARPGRPSQTSFHLGPRSRLARADSWTPGRDGGCRSRLAHLCCARTWAPLRYGLLRLGTAQDKSRLWRAIIVSHYRLQHYYSFLLHQPRNLLAISTSQCLDTELKFHCEGDGQ
jgi:hypothetical protein